MLTEQQRNSLFQEAQKMFRHFDFKNEAFFYTDWDRDVPFADIMKSLEGCSDVYNGMTKVVLYSKVNEKVVFKYPICGYTYNSEVDEVDDETIDDGDYVDFKYAEASLEKWGDSAAMADAIDTLAEQGCVLCEWDYCAIEAVLTYLVEHSSVDFGDMFVGTYYLGNINNVPIYVSKRMETEYDEFDGEKISQEEMKEAADSLDCGTYTGMPTGMAAWIVRQYGLDKFNQLLHYMINNGFFKDCHEGNVMYDKDGRIHITDFAGYNE